MTNFYKIQGLLRSHADIKSIINLIPYDGSPEIKT